MPWFACSCRPPAAPSKPTTKINTVKVKAKPASSGTVKSTGKQAAAAPEAEASKGLSVFASLFGGGDRAAPEETAYSLEGPRGAVWLISGSEPQASPLPLPLLPPFPVPLLVLPKPPSSALLPPLADRNPLVSQTRIGNGRCWAADAAPAWTSSSLVTPFHVSTAAWRLSGEVSVSPISTPPTEP